MSDFEIFLLGLYKIIKQFWPVILYLIIIMPKLRRCEKDEDERVKKAIKEKDSKRIYHMQHDQEF